MAISSPTGEVVEVAKITRQADNCVVEYEPFEVGPHQIRSVHISNYTAILVTLELCFFGPG